MSATARDIVNAPLGLRVWLTTAAIVGMATGLIEAIVRLSIQVDPGWMAWPMRILAISPDFLWIAPVVNAGLFVALVLPLSLCLVVLARMRPSAAPRLSDGILLVLLGLSAYVVLSAPYRLHGWAISLLAGGLSWRLHGPLRRLAQDRRRRRRAAASLAAIVLACFAGVGVVGSAAEAVAVRNTALQPAPRPNVLLIVLDTVRADHLSTYGYDRDTTPRIDRLAADGTLFTRAYSPSGWTLPSHASMFTGRPPREHGADSPKPWLDEAYPTLAEVLASNGYLTAGFSANTLWATRTAGFARGFSHFEDYFHDVADWTARTALGRVAVAPLWRVLGGRGSLGRKSATEQNRSLLRWIDALPEDRPFFAFVNYMDAHGPYISPAPFHTKFMTTAQRQGESGFAFDPPSVSSDAKPGEGKLYAVAYDGALSYLDFEVGGLIDALAQRGLRDDTLVIVTSDHGEAFDEHGLYQHGHSLYRHQIHVPLVVRWPGVVPAGKRVTAPVSTADLGATILRLAGVPAPAFPGVPLDGLWTGAGSPRAALSEIAPRQNLPPEWPIAKGYLRSLMTEEWHFLQHEDGRVELYDARADPDERRNLAALPESAPVVRQLEAELHSRLGATP